MNAVTPAHLHRPGPATLRPLSPDALAVLKLLAVSGPSTRHYIQQLLPSVRDCRVTLTNLLTQQYIYSDHDQKPVTYALTAKARTRLEYDDQVPARKARVAAVATKRATYLSGEYHAPQERYGPRPGAGDAPALPSRFGNTLRWPDGRHTDLEGSPLHAQGASS